VKWAGTLAPGPSKEESRQVADGPLYQGRNGPPARATWGHVIALRLIVGATCRPNQVTPARSLSKHSIL
jgi:hypothetical protein